MTNAERQAPRANFAMTMRTFTMKTMKHRFPALLLLAVMGLASTAQAALISRLGGQAVYDTDRNITWLANANTNGPMTWNAANTWAARLNIGGYTGWRLPTALNADGSGPCYGFNCTGSEFGHLFYDELGGVAGKSITTTHNANFNLFSNIQSSVYWSGTEYTPDPSGMLTFATYGGLPGYSNKVNFWYGWAVRSGDVATVPEPDIAWMMLVGGCAVWVHRRTRRIPAQHHPNSGNVRDLL